MAHKAETDAQTVLEKIRGAGFSEIVPGAILRAVYAIEHEKQFEDDRKSVEAALRDIIVEAVQEES